MCGAFDTPSINCWIDVCSVLAACETMGNATTICSDKTGTLTKNRMTVVRVYAGKRDFPQATEAAQLGPELVEHMAMSAAINSESKSLYTVDAKSGLPNQQGNKTECAFLQFADAVAAHGFMHYREQHPESAAVKVHPFSSSKKRMSTVIRHGAGYRMYVKGASEILLPLCVRQSMGATVEALGRDEIVCCVFNGLVDSLALQDKLMVDVIGAYGAEALRVLLLAYRDFDAAQEWDNEEALVADLTLIAIGGIQVCCDG